ncbi:MAG: 6,7-dimethyl-8-ribityllumazine synthase [Elusimicrobia bacterium]|nr:6,7-dimethyl-8-ribityllumazine synthase [Candidatus Obscuribacterium magneticum]
MKKHGRIGIVVSEFNFEFSNKLLASCRHELIKEGLPKKNITTLWVPGAYELPFMAQKMARSKRYDAIIGLGIVIKGETSHDVHVANWASIGMGLVSLGTGVPILYGVLTPKNEAQAKARVGQGPLNRGREIAKAALKIIELNS